MNYNNYTNDDDDENINSQLIFRLKYNDEKPPLYVEMKVITWVTGVIFVSEDANTFMKIVLNQYKDAKKNLIYESLREDGIYVDDDDDDDDNYDEEKEVIESGKKIHTLKYICNENISENKNMFDKEKSHVPKVVEKNINEYIRIKEEKMAYNNINIKSAMYTLKHDFYIICMICLINLIN